MGEDDLRAAKVADLCSGSGALAIAAARAGAAHVLAVDISLRAVLATRLNALLNGVTVQTRRGDVIEQLDGERFDLIVSNPPYVPAASASLPRHRRTTALDGGLDGRAVLDRICRQASHSLLPGGTLLLVHSSVCGEERTCELLREHGLAADVLARAEGTLGPVLRSRAAMLRERGLLGEADVEELIVVRGRAPLNDA